MGATVARGVNYRSPGHRGGNPSVADRAATAFVRDEPADREILETFEHRHDASRRLRRSAGVSRRRRPYGRTRQQHDFRIDIVDIDEVHSPEAHRLDREKAPLLHGSAAAAAEQAPSENRGIDFFPCQFHTLHPRFVLYVSRVRRAWPLPPRSADR